MLPSYKRKNARKVKKSKKRRKKFSSRLKPFLILISLKLIKNKLKAKTKPILAILDPSAFPIAILGFSFKLAMMDIKISGEDVAIPIKTKLEIKCERFKYLESFSVLSTNKDAPTLISARPTKR